MKEYKIPDQGDTIYAYLLNPDTTPKTNLFLYIQGSVSFPMVHRTDSIECCFSNYPKKIAKQFPKEYAFVYINKMGLPYYTNMDHFTPGNTFVRRNNVSDRAAVADKVIRFLLKNVFRRAKTVAVLGHSEGSDVVARLAVMNKKVTHICFASGNGTPQLFNDILFIRRKMHLGTLTPERAQQQLDTLFQQMADVLQDPENTEKRMNGDTYKWHAAINQPAIENLLQLSIPIYLTIGSADDKVPIEATDYIKSEFVRRKKTNLTYKIYLNCNHGYVEKTQNDERIDRFPELFSDFLQFIETTGNRR